MALPGPSPLGGKAYPPVDAVHAFNAYAFVHHTVELPTRNLRVHVVECGPKDGVPVLMCHGFPEMWMSWAHQMPVLAAAGYRVFAPDLRGYGYTKPITAAADGKLDVREFTHKQICTDLDALHTALNVPAAVYVGHDWGGAIVWQMARRFPARVLAVAGVCTPFRPRTSRYTSAADIAKVFPVMYYQVYFAEDGGAAAAKELEGDVEHTIRCFFRTTKPADRLSARWITPETRATGLFGAVPKPAPKSELMSSEEYDAFVAAYRHSGFHAALQWYCAHPLNWREEGEIPQRVEQPALMVTAGKDGVLIPKLSEGMEKWVPRLQRAHIVNAGHWVQMEQPAELAAVLLRWLNALNLQSGAKPAPLPAPPAAAAAAAAAGAGAKSAPRERLLSKL